MLGKESSPNRSRVSARSVWPLVHLLQSRIDEAIVWLDRARIGNPGHLGHTSGSRQPMLSAYARMTAWLDENCGADGWAMTPSGTRGVLNDAASIYFLDTTLADALVARWCAGYRVETAGGVFQVRDDDPAPRVGAALHRTP
jgi:hypothetical protein